MIYKQFGDTIAVRLERGEEILTCLRCVCRSEGVTAGTITGLGAVDHAVVGVFNVPEQKYCSTTFDEPMEITCLTGNVSAKDGETYLHVHATLAGADAIARGGHLNEGRISATCEVFIRPLEGTIERRMDPEIGINLMEF